MPIMTITLLLIVAGCLSASTFVPFIADAQEGRITFSGAVVTPTCSVATPVIAMAADVRSAVKETRQLTCATSANASLTVPQRYALTAVLLSSSVPDRVLKYFDDYVRASRSDAADPVLLTQVYD
jgi:hypothetical protein